LGGVKDGDAKQQTSPWSVLLPSQAFYEYSLPSAVSSAMGDFREAFAKASASLSPQPSALKQLLSIVNDPALRVEGLSVSLSCLAGSPVLLATSADVEVEAKGRGKGAASNAKTASATDTPFELPDDPAEAEPPSSDTRAAAAAAAAAPVAPPKPPQSEIRQGFSYASAATSASASAGAAGAGRRTIALAGDESQSVPSNRGTAAATTAKPVFMQGARVRQTSSGAQFLVRDSQAKPTDRVYCHPVADDFSVDVSEVHWLGPDTLQLVQGAASPAEMLLAKGSRAVNSRSGVTYAIKHVGPRLYVCTAHGMRGTLNFLHEAFLPAADPSGVASAAVAALPADKQRASVPAPSAAATPAAAESKLPAAAGAGAGKPLAFLERWTGDDADKTAAGALFPRHRGPAR
jgi:hypothetical protein